MKINGHMEFSNKSKKRDWVKYPTLKSVIYSKIMISIWFSCWIRPWSRWMPCLELLVFSVCAWSSEIFLQMLSSKSWFLEFFFRNSMTFQVFHDPYEPCKKSVWYCCWHLLIPCREKAQLLFKFAEYFG